MSSIFHKIVCPLLVLLSGIIILSSSSSSKEPSIFDEFGEEALAPHKLETRKVGGGRRSKKGSEKAHAKESIIQNCLMQGQFGLFNECSKYQTCKSIGSFANTAYCNQDKMFHHQKRKCLKISLNQCKESMCKSAEETFPDPYSTENFLSCKNLIPEVEPCPEGQIYKAEEEHCINGSPMDGLRSASEEDHSAEVPKNKLVGGGSIQTNSATDAAEK